MSREEWVGPMRSSDLARAEVMSLRTTVLAQQLQIRELQSADRRRQTMILELLAADYRRQRQLTEALKLVKSLQNQMAELQRQQGPAKGPAQPKLPEEAVDIEANEDEEEEEHPAPTDSVVVALPATDQAPSAEETKPFETNEFAATPPPHPAYRVTARISIPTLVPTPVWSNAEVSRLLAISTPPSSLSPHVSPPLPVSSPVPVLSPSPPASPIRPLGYRAAMIRLRAEATSTSYSLPLPPPLHLISTDRREDRPEVTLPPRKRLGIALGLACEIRCDPQRDVGYGITDSWDEIVETLQRAPVSTNTELGRHMTAFETRVRQDTDEIYMRLYDEQSQRQLLAGRLNMLFRDRRAHAHTRFLMKTDARMSREAWVGSMGASDLARTEVMSLRTTVLAQQSQIRELQSADHRR
ncbi:hypothetical protein Tco_0269408 [Tanacetum coccineum]